jgi:membrane-bound serine protease (ClpP class)
MQCLMAQDRQRLQVVTAPEVTTMTSGRRRLQPALGLRPPTRGGEACRLGAMKRIASGLLLLAALSMAFAAMLAAQPRAASAPVALVAIDGPIGPATTDLVRRALASAEADGMQALILRIDTPGGLDAATRDIDQLILAAPLPVVAWVAPGGARVASAGTYILYATHVAAMAPGTHLGAATPVPLGGAPRPEPRRPGREADDEDETADPPRPGEPATAMERKILHDSAAYIRSLAELRGRNAEWAERAVREGVSLTATEALAQQVIELIAADLPALLAGLDGRTVRIGERDITLATIGAEVREIEPDWRNRLLALLTNPSVAYLLLLAGLYGLLLEGYSPGALVPGVVGVVCLLLAAYALQVLPVNYAGLALIVVGVLLMVAEVVTPSFGVLGIGGVVALVLGSIVLFDADVPGFGVSRGLIGGIALLGASGMLAMLFMLQRSRRRPVQTGSAELLQASAVALEDFSGRGRVRVRGEVWQAVSEVPVRAGERLQVIAIDGLTLQVRPF